MEDPSLKSPLNEGMKVRVFFQSLSAFIFLFRDQSFLPHFRNICGATPTQIFHLFQFLIAPQKLQL